MERFRLGDHLKSFNNMLLLDEMEKFERKATSFAGLPELMNKFMLHVAAAADIPVTRLFGQSAMGLNATGEGDERNYHERITSDQENRFGPALESVWASAASA
jgi:phage-related protein (TIGR01555 family)